MRKQFTIFLILIFVLGLALVNFTTNSKAQIESVLVAHWDFNEGSGDIVNDIIGEYNATRVGATWISGAMEFDGDGDYVSTNPQHIPTMPNFTFTINLRKGTKDFGWGEARKIASVNGLTVILGRNTDHIHISGFGYGYPSGSTRVSIHDSGAYLTLVFDGSNIEIYKNGYLVHSLPVLTPPSSSAYPVSFGATNPDCASIIINDAKLYNVNLTAEEVLDDYQHNGLSCTEDIWSCGSWGQCSINGIKTRACTKIYDCRIADTPSPETTQSCIPECTEDIWSCENWGTCSVSGNQTRICTKIYDCSLVNTPSPSTSQSCTPECTKDTWSCGSWGSCLSNGQQSRICNKTFDCSLIDTPSPATTQSCVYTPACTSNNWSCSNWSVCSTSGQQTRACNKTSNCEGGVSSPATTQSCSYTPPCTEDTWQCGNWGTCSPQGIQTRSCNKTYDCPSAETASPSVFQYCEPPATEKTDQPQINYNSKIKATTQLLCYDHRGIIGSGSGTIIDSRGIILTNKHVVQDRYGNDVVGCYVGFTNDINRFPDFSKTAYVLNKSNYRDIAILKIKGNNYNYSYVDISSGNSDNLTFGKKIYAYGYPVYNKHPKTVTDLIQKITFSSGDFSGY